HFSLSFLQSHPAPSSLHSFPTRRSSDLHSILCARHGDQGRGSLCPRAWATGGHASIARCHPSNLGGALPPPALSLWRYRERKIRSEEHTSELQSPYDLVCRLLLEKKKKQ